MAVLQLLHYFRVDRERQKIASKTGQCLGENVRGGGCFRGPVSAPSHVQPQPMKQDKRPSFFPWSAYVGRCGKSIDDAFGPDDICNTNCSFGFRDRFPRGPEREMPVSAGVIFSGETPRLPLTTLDCVRF